jgi:hypothetical protein
VLMDVTEKQKLKSISFAELITCDITEMGKSEVNQSGKRKKRNDTLANNMFAKLVCFFVGHEFDTTKRAYIPTVFDSVHFWCKRCERFRVM